MLCVKPEIHEGNFDSDAPDEVWLAEVGRRGWVVLLKDDREAGSCACWVQSVLSGVEGSDWSREWRYLRQGLQADSAIQPGQSATVYHQGF
jgi:hypothetical protein